VVKNGKYDLACRGIRMSSVGICDGGGKPFGEEIHLQLGGGRLLYAQEKEIRFLMLSTRACANVTKQARGKYTSCRCWRGHVVNAMKATKAVIGGEGMAASFFPDLHYGRDVLDGDTLFSETHLAQKKIKASELRAQYPAYVISKNKIELTPQINVNKSSEDVKASISMKISHLRWRKIDFDNNGSGFTSAINTGAHYSHLCESRAELKPMRLAKKIIRRHSRAYRS